MTFDYINKHTKNYNLFRRIKMLNQTVLVGRLVEKPREMVKQKIFITLAVPRPYKNTVGEYDTDFVDVV